MDEIENRKAKTRYLIRKNIMDLMQSQLPDLLLSSTTDNPNDHSAIKFSKNLKKWQLFMYLDLSPQFGM
jgi:hypothetical protein